VEGVVWHCDDGTLVKVRENERERDRERDQQDEWRAWCGTVTTARSLR